MQLEESNNTLSKDVESLSKEKTDLSQELNTREEGTAFGLFVLKRQSFLVQNVFLLSEYKAQREETENALRAQYEKILSTERTLKTQVNTGSSEALRRDGLLSPVTPPHPAGRQQAGGDHEPPGYEGGPEEEGKHGRSAQEGKREPQASAGAEPGEGQVQPHGHQESEGAERDAGGGFHSRHRSWTAAGV